jgi:hypothetical protein
MTHTGRVIALSPCLAAGLTVVVTEQPCAGTPPGTADCDDRYYPEPAASTRTAAIRSRTWCSRDVTKDQNATTASSALWSLLRADGASGSSHRCVQCHGGANERLERLFINLVALMEIDGAPGVAFEAGVEEA